MIRRLACVLAVAVPLLGCGVGPPVADLTSTGFANLKAAKTAHLEGTFAATLKAGSASLPLIAFFMSGDTELPHNARMNIRIEFERSDNIDALTVDGNTWSKDAVSARWLWASRPATDNFLMDRGLILSLVSEVVEVDRPEFDGHKTRHLKYTVDPLDLRKMVEAMAWAPSYPTSNLHGIGELWIRNSDSQILRQLVKASFDIDLPVAGESHGIPYAAGPAAVEMTLDLRFSRHGEATPRITAPPTGP